MPAVAALCDRLGREATVREMLPLIFLTHESHAGLKKRRASAARGEGRRWRGGEEDDKRQDEEKWVVEKLEIAVKERSDADRREREAIKKVKSTRMMIRKEADDNSARKKRETVIVMSKGLYDSHHY